MSYLGTSRDLIDRLVREAYEYANSQEQGIRISAANNLSWQHLCFKRQRSLDSVVLPEGMLQELADELAGFLRSEDWYHDRGIPYQRGYLFHGTPGSGKTSAVMALAGELGLSVGLLPLSDYTVTDSMLGQYMGRLPARSILLIEDIDAVFVQRDNHMGVTFAGLLNALDGVLAPEGRILVMTTNHPERLDPALIRPGRVDRQVAFSHATPDQARRLFNRFFSDRLDELGSRLDWFACEFAERIPEGQVSMAALQEHLLRHRDSPLEASRAAFQAAIAA